MKIENVVVNVISMSKEKIIKTRTKYGQAYDVFKLLANNKDIDLDYDLWEYSKWIIEYIDFLEQENNKLHKINEYFDCKTENEKYCYLANNPNERCRKDIFEEIKKDIQKILGEENDSKKDMV